MIAEKEVQLKNRYSLSEFSGAVGDLGTTLPLAFALIISNGFPAGRIFFLWGVVYLVTGWYYKVPVSVQPLKAMAVIAITAGFSTGMLSTAALMYGLLFVLLSGTGLISYLEKWFSQAIVRGVQLGIGLLLAQKALSLIYKKTLYLNGEVPAGKWIFLLVAATIFLLIAGRYIFKKPVALFIILGSILSGLLLGIHPVSSGGGPPVLFSMPEWSRWANILILLIIPQIPLTLGNAVYAANDACHEFWPERSVRVSPGKLGGSIGLANILIGLTGGFPVCHGAGGMAAHHRFGAKTGGTTIILGGAFILLGLVDKLSLSLFLIPIPILGTLLFFDSWQMIILIRRLPNYSAVAAASVVGIVSLVTHNLTIALLAGLITERILKIERLHGALEKVAGRRISQNFYQYLIAKLKWSTTDD